MELYPQSSFLTKMCFDQPMIEGRFIVVYAMVRSLVMKSLFLFLVKDDEIIIIKFNPE
jgi:hypothetical protein